MKEISKQRVVQLVEHTSPKLVGWVRFDSRSCHTEDMKNGTLLPVQPRAR